MRKQVVVLFILLLAVSGCAATQSARRDYPALKMARTIDVGGRHCH